MKVAIYKHSWVFSDQAGDQWTETYYHNGGTPGGEFLAPFQQLVDARLALLPTSMSLVRVKVADITGNRNAAFKPYGLAGTYAAVIANLAPRGSAWVIQAYQGINLIPQRKIWLRGGYSSDHVMTPGGAGLPTGFWTFRFNGWALQALSYQYGYVPRVSQKVNVPISATSVDGKTTPGLAAITLTGPPAAGWAATGVLLSRFSQKDLPGLKGFFNVVSIAGNVVTVRYATPGNQIVAVSQGQARQFSQAAFQVFGLLQFAYCGTRNTKSFFTQSRGAKRAPRTRSLA